MMTEKDAISPDSPFMLSDKTAIVTGGGRGIGSYRATTRINGSERTRVRFRPRGIAGDEGIRPDPERVATIRGDLMQSEAPQQIVDATLEAFGSIDIIVNCAGFSWDSVIQKTTDEQFMAMLNIHIMAPFRLLRAASGHLRETAKR